MYLYLNKSFLFQETIILDRQNKKFKQEENLKFKSDLFKLRYLICNEKKKIGIPSKFSYDCYGISKESSLKYRFTNDRLKSFLIRNDNHTTSFDRFINSIPMSKKTDY